MSTVVDAAKNVFLTVRGRPASRRTIRGHKSEVEAVAFFKDSQRVVTCSKDTTLRIWDVQKGALIGGSFEGHKDWVRSVAVSPDDRRMVSGGRDKRIIMWDVESKQMVFEPLVKHTHWVESVCFSPDGKRFASGSQDFTVVVWNAETGAVITTLDSHRGSVWSVAFSPDGLKLASGSSDCSIRVWNAVNPELLFEIDAHKNPVRSVVWSSDGQQLVSASYGSVMFWNSSNGDQNGLTCTGHTDWIRSLDISSDNSFIAAASDDKTVRLWSTKTHRNIGQALEHLAGLLCVAISPDGKWLVSGDNEGRVWFWFLKNILKQYEAEVEQQRQLTNRTSKTLSTHLIQPSDRDSIIKKFDFLAINTTIRDAGYFHTPEELLVQEIDADNNNSDSYANRSIVRARIFDWDNALQDAVKSISIQPSLMGYISKGIALCGNDQVLDAMEAFDLAFVFSNRDPMNIDLLLLIKAVALFNAGRHDEAMRRVQDLATACQQLDTLSCRVVEAYLLVQLATIDFQSGQYNEAADQFTANINTITRLFLHAALLEPRWKIFTLLFGWDFDSLWQTVNQRRCDSLLRAGRLTEAVESHQYMMSRISDAAKDSCLEWSTSK
ncbi:WD40-repeat-containing domain protein [Suillus clintonianus]|uniref:WD40-repeat-containing domain protein n=1 Tax=Suillus clintonianus TaxID=1904413 RepID=UPI001B869534|nr:WD40-repeat-containing domain protein [Suillus clintonianus]KAG2135248.1 WD40-repeat-containing domain protein [Suillus clintonianus]